jgi:Spy/CpxP family protein refolding chaperone
MTKRGFYGFLMAGSLVLNVAFIGMWMAHAAPRHMMKHSQCGSSENCRQACALQKALSMSDSQWTLLKPRIESYRAAAARLRADIAGNRAALVEELEKTPIDSASLSACKGRIVACQKDLQDLVANHILDERNMLTPDQRRRYFEALRSNMSCAGMPGMAGMAPEQCGKR